jgi:hypothetical protein
MVKNYFRLGFVAVISALVVASCCSEQNPFRRFDTLETYVYGLNNNYYDSIFYQDTLFVQLNLRGNCVTQNRSFGFPFINTANATSKYCDCGDKGMKSPIVSLKIFTNDDYALFAPQSDVTHLFSYCKRVNYYNNTTYLEYYPFSQIIEDITNVGFVNNQGGSVNDIFITTPPGDSLPHSFHTTFTFVNGTTLEANTGNFQWLR